MIRWIGLWFIAALLSAAAAHMLLTLRIPGIAMERAHGGMVAAAGGANRMLAPPPPDHTARGVVRPAADLVYAVCAYDLSDGPVAIAFDPPKDSYWSLSFFQMNTDVIELISNRTHGHGPLRVTVMDQPKKGEDLVYSPSQRGLALIRMYLRDRETHLAQLQTHQNSARCDVVN